ncbi:MAG: adenylyltransferase/cytidyltransferase family protein [Candidatus Omnitrophica bacterium]|nr:adenylyltransferase/cytidyltransferase family protein [Candidatus Omnitrophota bacterium]MCM8826142.1 adenylyltransferase/cytidyltransferase family protein [Candidatus Omnitrophota bacterium]
MNKIKNLKELKNIAKNLKSKGNKLVFTNGCFDLIHPGHIKILKEAKKQGDILIVGINSDSSIKKIKGNLRPILNQNARVEIISSIEYVDYVTIFDEPTPYRIIKTLKPDILVKGGDWYNKKVIGETMVDKVYFVKLLKGYSSTKLIEKILNKYGKHNQTN